MTPALEMNGPFRPLSVRRSQEKKREPFPTCAFAIALIAVALAAALFWMVR